MTNNFWVISLLVIWLVAMEVGCALKKKRKDFKNPTLHNYPMHGEVDCPNTFRPGAYNSSYVRDQAAKLNMRPVDYLHHYNNKRWKPINKSKNVGLRNYTQNE